MKKSAFAVIDMVLPRRCPVCGTGVHGHDGFCAGCWGKLSFIASPRCDRCGEPFEVPTSFAGQQCGLCMADPPLWQQARALWRYDDASRPVITALKYADRTELAKLTAAALLRTGSDVLVRPDAVLIPVPLHRWRLLKRTYNQSALLAQSVAAISGHRLLLDGLIRHRATPPQQGLTRLERQRNVAKAFMVNRRHMAMIDAQPIVLIDDVLTTGATLGACSMALLAAGADRVDVLTLARVVGQRHITV